MIKSNHHLPFRKMVSEKSPFFITFNYCLKKKKRQTYLPTPFIKCAGLQGLSGAISIAAQKSKEELG